MQVFSYSYTAAILIALWGRRGGRLRALPMARVYRHPPS